jgi:signal transduction histidine kinase
MGNFEHDHARAGHPGRPCGHTTTEALHSYGRGAQIIVKAMELDQQSAASVPRAVPAQRRFTYSPQDYLPERVDLLYRLCGGDTPMILFVGAVAAFALWGLVQTPLLLAWGLWLCVGSLVRYALARLYARNKPAPERAATWENLFCLASGAMGAAWGLSILLVTPNHPSMQELTITFLLSSISMGLPPSLAPSPKSFASFVLPIIVPIVALLFTTGGDINVAAALLLLMLTGVLLSIYVSANRALIATLSQGRENTHLLERVRAAVQTSALAVWEWDAASLRFDIDAAWSSMLREPAFVSSLDLPALLERIHPEDRDSFRKAWSECLDGTRPDLGIEMRVRRSDGDSVWFLTRARAAERLASGEAKRIIGTHLDISKRKAAETELFTALQREKELSEMKSKFVSIASHELRTPLTTILSSSELLEHYSESLSGEERKGLLQSIQEAVHRMTALINNVLIIGKSGAGKLNFSPSPMGLGEFVENLVETMRSGEGRARRIMLDCKLEHDNRMVDEPLLRHIMNNLLSNAIKYSPEGSSVNVRVADWANNVVIEVADQGIGIPEKDQAQLFESFHRASNVGDRPGTGLGLAIVKTAAELHGGRVQVESKAGKGTRFTVSLQADRA